VVERVGICKPFLFEASSFYREGKTPESSALLESIFPNCSKQTKTNLKAGGEKNKKKGQGQ